MSKVPKKVSKKTMTYTLLAGVGMAAVLFVVGYGKQYSIDVVSDKEIATVIEEHENSADIHDEKKLASQVVAEPKDPSKKTNNDQASSEEASIESPPASQEVDDFELGLPLPNDIEGLLEVALTLMQDSTTAEAVAALKAAADADPLALEKISGALLEQLQATDDFDARQDLFGYLLYFPSEEVTQYSLELLNSENASDRESAYELLSQSNHVDPVNLLQKVWEEPDSFLAERAIDAIGERETGLLERKYTVEQKQKLNAALHSVYSSHEESNIRAKALTQLSRLDDDESVRSMVESALNDENSQVRSAAVSAIAEKEYYSDANKEKLFSLLANEATDKSTLHITADALSYGFELQETEKQQLLELKKKLNERG